MNITLFYFLYSLTHHTPWIDSLIWFFAVPSIYLVMGVVGIMFLIRFDFWHAEHKITFFRDKGRVLTRIFLSAGTAYGFAYLLKHLIHTDRPFVLFSNVQSLFLESGYAFPSGHSATIAAFSFSVFFADKRVGYVCMVFALLIGCARIAAGVHFPIDIIGGYLLGFLVAFFVKSL